MAGTALTLWSLTVAGGGALLLIWVARGGYQRPADETPYSTTSSTTTATQTEPNETRSRIGMSSIVPHASLAVIGAITWALYSANSNDKNYRPAAWLALVLLLVTIGYGLSMFSRWLVDRRDGGADKVVGDRRPEQHFPTALVLGHGAMALATLVAVAIAILV